jgi:hypothetical protein
MQDLNRKLQKATTKKKSLTKVSVLRAFYSTLYKSSLRYSNFIVMLLNTIHDLVKHLNIFNDVFVDQKGQTN